MRFACGRNGRMRISCTTTPQATAIPAAAATRMWPRGENLLAYAPPGQLARGYHREAFSVDAAGTRERRRIGVETRLRGSAA